MSDQQAVTIPLDKLTADDRYQARGDGLSESHVRLLMESDPQDWPPILCAPNGDGTYGLRDGAHRTEAARRLGVPALRCNVVEGAGYPEAVMANIAHGLSLSRADRKDAARWWAEHEPGVSYREIGLRVGLSDKTVKAALTKGERPAQTRPASDPLDRWLHATYRLDSPPSPRDVKAEIDAYEEADRPDVAKVYAAVGKALIEATATYGKGR
jgi:ParB-like chromosome segregation protein Spo0J